MKVEALLAKNQELSGLVSSILEQSGDAVVVCNGRGRIIQASPLAQDLCGRKPLQERFDDLFPLEKGSDQKPFYPVQALQGETFEKVPARLRRNGRSFHLLVSAAPLKESRQEIIGCVVTMTDITARRQAGEALKVAEERLKAQTEESHAQREELQAQTEELQAQTEELRGQKEESQELAEDLEAERARLKAVLEHMPAGVIIAQAPSGKILLVNRQMEEILGHPVPLTQSLETYLPYQAFFPDGRPYLPEDYPLARSLKQDLVILDEEINMVKGDGSPGVIRASATPIRDRAGAVLAVVGIYDDITERKQAEKEIARLASFPQLNPNPILEVDYSGAITFYNAAAAKVLAQLGSPGEEKDLLPKDMAAILAEAKTGARLFYREVEINDATFAESIHFPLDLPVARIYSMDITERKRAEQALRRAKEEWESTFDAVPDLIAILDRNHRIVRGNRAMAEALGRTPQELVGLVCHEYMQTA